MFVSAASRGGSGCRRPSRQPPRAPHRRYGRVATASLVGSILHLLPGLLSGRRKLVHLIQKQREGPNLLVGQGASPRGHTRPADAVLYFPKGEAFGIVFDPVRRQLRRPRVETFRHRRGRRVSLRGAVADGAVPPIKLDAGNQIGSVSVTGLGPLGASRSRVASNDVFAAQISSHPGSASALAGTRPLRRTMYPHTAATTIVARTPSRNALTITPSVARGRSATAGPARSAGSAR